MRRLWYLGLLGLLWFLPQSSMAAGYVGICDTSNPNNCAAVNSSGQVAIQGSFSATVATIVVTSTNKAGTITSGGTAQNAIAANASRKSWCIQNDPNATEPLYVRASGTASATVADAALVPGQPYCSSSSMVDQGAISVFAATTGHQWYGSEAQ